MTNYLDSLSDRNFYIIHYDESGSVKKDVSRIVNRHYLMYSPLARALYLSSNKTNTNYFWRNVSL